MSSEFTERLNLLEARVTDRNPEARLQRRLQLHSPQAVQMHVFGYPRTVR